MPCTYILFSRQQHKFYIGSTRNDTAKQRLKSHNAGKTRSTKSGRPWSIIYEIQYQDYTKARKEEMRLKSGRGRKWIKDNFGYLKK